MFYTVVGSITGVAFILLIFAINYNKFQFTIVKIDEAESNTEMFLKKKVDLIKRLIPIIKKKLKIKKYMEKELEYDYDSLDSFELNDKLSDLYLKVSQTIDENEKLLKSEKIVKLLDEIEDNEENLVASIKFYNDSVSKYNSLILSFPSNIIRLFFGYRKKSFYNDEVKEEK